jgi:hypothetical protein
MAIKREAAYHEAAHAILAHRSRFHALVGPISLEKYGAGEAFVSLSKSKLRAQGKPETLDVQRDPEVVRDLALVLVAGYVAEQIAAESDNALRPNIACAIPDHDLLRKQLSSAGLSEDFDQFEAQARITLKTEWALVERVAQHLFKSGGAEPETILALLS